MNTAMRLAGTPCLGCKKNNVEPVLDLGSQPPSNLFLGNPAQPYSTHPMKFGACTSCGLAQLIDPMSESMVRCTHDWLRYDEPEQHLDDLAAYLHSALGSQKVRASGVSYKDTTLLDRLQRQGWCTAPVTSSPLPQAQFDVLIARHILEHARNPQQFVAACSAKLRPGGLLIFEVPGFERMLHKHQHCFLWEEHILYFTRLTLKVFLRSCNLEVLEILEYPLPLENSLVALARPVKAESSVTCCDKEIQKEQLGLVRSFGLSLHRQRVEKQTFLQRISNSGKVISMFGAGHLGMKYIHFYGLQQYLKTVLDDHPQKTGTFLPGSLLPITTSSWLAQNPEGLCLVAINPEKHAVLQQRHPYFASGGGAWHSIFSDISCPGM